MDFAGLLDRKVASLVVLVRGAVGTLRLNYQLHLGKDAVGELDAKVYGKKHDQITINESLFLDGENLRGLAWARCDLCAP